MKIVKDDNQRVRILRQLVYATDRVLEVDADYKISIRQSHWKPFSITEPGMLYEITAMVSHGWLKRVSAQVRNKGIFAYVVTALGLEAYQDLRPTIYDRNKKAYLEKCNTHELLAMLRSTRSPTYSGYWYDDWYYEDDQAIKEELAKRPHVMNRFERRKKFSKKEKGDARRVRQKRYKQVAS